ncbi:unnamed protein product [Schistosoma margrebowiei]|uniref:Uncharacterized protein n=1 Tax=Schistosoma margrebowiei TaxID=48269 RepID=A0A183MLV3_9TREM|nr:unnamed protein product [Schistosoma margrebowiei]
MQMKTTSVAPVSSSVGLNKQKRKTKILKLTTKNTNAITIDDEPVEEVESFTYLDSIVYECGGSDVNVNARISETRTAFLPLKNIWNSKQLSSIIKITIFNMNVKIVLLHGAET